MVAINRMSVLAAGGLTVAAVLIFKIYRRNKDMSMKIPGEDAFHELVGNCESIPSPGLTEAAKKNLIERIQGMNQVELELVANTIPIELCLNRIHKEIDKARKFESLVKNAIGSLD